MITIRSRLFCCTTALAVLNSFAALTLGAPVISFTILDDGAGVGLVMAVASTDIESFDREIEDDIVSF